MTAKSALKDLSSMARVGFAGTESARRLRDLDLQLPTARFDCAPQTDGSLVAMLNGSEFLWLGSPERSCAALTRAQKTPDGSACYQIHWRSSHAWFALSGAGAPDRLSEICDMDLAPTRFANLRCAPVMLTRIPALVVRWDRAEFLQLHLLAPRPHAAALWEWFEERESMDRIVDRGDAGPHDA